MNIPIPIASLALLAVFTTVAPPAAADEQAGQASPGSGTSEPGAAMILSTGDNIFYYNWFPVDSRAGMASSFDIFKQYFGIDRLIWRGAQAQWMNHDSFFRPEPMELYDLYRLEMDLETHDRLSHVAAEEAEKRGMAFWGYNSFFEVGVQAEAVSMAGFGGYAFEERIRAEHPEWCLYDRAGIMRGSTIEFGYPEARAAFVKKYDELLAPGGEFDIYEGVIHYSYVENFFPRVSDQFIYSDVAAAEFKKRYGIDVYTEDFDIELYQAMRGEWVTQYLRELRAVFNKHGKKLAFYIDGNEPDLPMRWPSYPDILVPGTVRQEWRTWIEEGLVDEIAVRSVSRQNIRQFIDAAKGTDVKISVLASRVSPELRQAAGQDLARHIWSPEMASTFPPGDRPASDIDSDDPFAVMSVLRQVRDGQIDLPVEAVTALFNHSNIMVRRGAVSAVVGRRMTGAVAALEIAAMDPDSGFRAMVIDALGTINGPDSAMVIARSLKKYPNFQMRLVARTAWSAMIPDRSGDVLAVYNNVTDPYVRLTITEMVIAKRAVPPIEALPWFRPVVAESAKADHEELRSVAAFAAAYYPDTEYAQLLLSMMDDSSEIVQNSAIFSLGEVARRLNDAALRQTIYDRLVQRLNDYGNGSTRNDLEWGYRVVAESLLHGFGPLGHSHLATVLNGEDTVLADLVWRVLFQPNDGWNYYPATREEIESFAAYHPAPPRQLLPHQVYTAPSTITLIRQNFEDVALDPTGNFGSPLSPTGQWSTQGTHVQIIADDQTGNCLDIGVNANGKGAKVVATAAWDMPDKRLRNRLRGHFPASPTTYGLAFGIAELSIKVRKTSDKDALSVALTTTTNADDHAIGFAIDQGGQVRTHGNHAGGASSVKFPSIQPGTWQEFNLRLNFTTGRAALYHVSGETSDQPVAEFAFDINQHYRALVISAEGEPETSSQFGEVVVTQIIE